MGVETKLEKREQLVNDDQRDLIDVFRETFAGVMTVEDTMRLTLRLHKQINDASDEIERLRNESEMWRNTCTKLIGMILPYSLLMRDEERKEIAIILGEAVDG
jgi:hypothetical protein